MITPMEIQNHEFRVKFKGYEKESVRHFLYAISEEFENLIEQNHQMANELAVLREKVKDMEARDGVLKETLVTAQQVKVDLQENAEKEAELIVREAQLKADSYIEAAREQVTHVRDRAAEVRRGRDDLLAEAEMMVARFNHFMEAERQLASESDKVQRFAVRSNRQPEKQRPIHQIKDAK